jgi:hypothetical protein
VAGTSTSVGTGIGGKVADTAGAPVPGAKVVARADHASYEDGVPSYPALDSTVTDRDGAFHLPALAQGAFHLEILGPSPRSLASAEPDPFPETYLAYYPAAPAGGSFGTLRIAPPGSVLGLVRAPAASDGAWLGVEGGSRFLPLRMPGGHPAGTPVEVRLDGVAPGTRRVMVFYQPDSTGAKIDPVEEDAVVKSGAVTDLGIIGD